VERITYSGRLRLRPCPRWEPRVIRPCGPRSRGSGNCHSSESAEVSTRKSPASVKELSTAESNSEVVNMGIVVERFDHIVINCRDVEATARWYVEVLGMTLEKFGPAARTSLKFGNQKINLRPLGARELDPHWDTGAVEAAGSEDLCFVTSATPDAVMDHLNSCGVVVIKGPVAKIGALGEMVSHYCRDLDGNLIEISVYA